MIGATPDSARDAARWCGSEAVNREPPAVEPGAAAPVHGLRTLLLMLGTVTVPIVALDQWSKLYVRAHMQLYEDIVLIPNFLDLTYALNPGAAFSMFANVPARIRLGFLFALSAVAIVVILVLLARSVRPALPSVALALILAGATGNLLDRALGGGEVIDFVRVHYLSYSWPIFNVADSAISIGVTLIFLSQFVSHKH